MLALLGVTSRCRPLKRAIEGRQPSTQALQQIFYYLTDSACGRLLQKRIYGNFKLNTINFRLKNSKKIFSVIIFN